VPGSDFLQEFGPFSCSALFLRNRLTLMDTCPNFDAKLAAPTTTLQALYMNGRATNDLQNEITATFKRGLWIDAIGRYGKLVVRVTDSPEIPTAEDRLQPDKMLQYREIEDEGDGLRSYVAICSAILLERRPLFLVDEPEMCLHPPQAHAMGRFIGKHVSEYSGTVISTHSSHVLRGILESNPAAHVIRLSRAGSRFTARLLKPDALAEATSKPRSRSEAMLEGLFSQGVVICEAEGDRIVYESVYRTLKDRKLDIRLIPSEGTGGIADPLRLYASLGVPSAVIADLDFLQNESALKSVCQTLCPDAEASRSLCTRAATLMRNVRTAAEPVDLDDVRKQLKSLSEYAADQASCRDGILRGKLSELVNQMHRLRKLKEVGVDSIPERWKPNDEMAIPLRQQATDLVADFASLGLFLVPVGELESWLQVLMDGVGREDKSRWAMLAAGKIEAVGERDEDVWVFMRRVIDFLSKHTRAA
jgi:hypothetical protein